MMVRNIVTRHIPIVHGRGTPMKIRTSLFEDSYLKESQLATRKLASK